MKKLFITVSVFLILILSITTGFPYNTKEKGEGGHVGLTEKSIELKKTKDIGLQKDLNDPNNYRSIMNAVSAEDAVITSEVIPRWMHHFYNPITGKGLPYFENARERSKKFYDAAVNSYCSGDKQKAWEMLGHALHPLQDMGSPPHVYNATHAFQQFFPTWGYENFVSNNWSQLEKQIVAEDCELSGGINNYIHQMALYTYSNYKKYDQEQITSSPISLDSILVSFNPPLYYTPIPVTRGEDPYPDPPNNTIALLNKVVCYSAGLIDTFWNDVYVNKCSPKLISSIPGGDHPDDTYEVSIPLEYGIDEAEYQCINMRLAMKKGRVGYYWAYLYGSKYQEIYNLPSDSPNDIIAQKFAELKDLEDLLNGYPYNETDDTNAAPDVAVLSNGYAEEAVRLLFKEKETARLIDPPFSINEVKNQPVFIIPSGGLYGLENSEILKGLLSEYVKNGGTLIVFAQQHGYEFSVLPVPQEADGAYNTMKGYGWTEDQSCLWNGTYIDTYHQILSAISTSTVSANVDGYFISYPSNSTILLRRTMNGQPAMLMYEYGNGRVVVSTLYSDWGYAHSQATQDEIKIVRNLISWAKKPEQLPEIKLSENVSISVSVTNNVDIDASSIKFHIYSPDRTKVVDEQLSAVSVPAGQSSIIPVSYSSSVSAALGIYHIDYELYKNTESNIIQPLAETDSGRFVVSNPSKSSYEISGLKISVTTSSESIFSGLDVPITVTLWNYTEADDRVRLYKGWDNLPRTFLDEVAVPAKGLVSKNYTIPNSASGKSLWIDVFSENGLKLTSKAAYHFTDETWSYAGSSGKGFSILYPSVSITTTTDKTLYVSGETVIINTFLKNNITASWQADVFLTILNFQNTNIYDYRKTVTLSPYTTDPLQNSFTLPATLAKGTYIVRVEALYGGRLIATAYTRFELPQSQISVTPTLPPAFTVGSNTIAFILKNMGKINVTAGTLDVSIKDPEGSIVFSVSHPFTIGIGESKTLDVPISIPSLKFGNYTLTFAQSDETRTGNPVTISIPNAAGIVLNFDKPSYKYRVRDNASLTVNLKNRGKFNLENMSVSVSVPDVNFTDIQTVSLSTNDSLQLTYTITISESITPGQHNADASLILPSGNSIFQDSKFVIPNALIKIDYSGERKFTAGDVIYLTVENTGGIDANSLTEIKLTSVNDAFTIYQDFINDIIQAGTSKTYSFQIPSQARSDGYILDTKVSGDLISTAMLSELIAISGIEADLTVIADKDVYLSTENINALVQIVNQTHEVNDATLRLQIVNKCSSAWVESFHVSTWDGTKWVERGVLHYSNILETQSFDLSAFFPDPSGDYKVRIANMGSVYAYVDYIGLMANGTAYTPNYAKELYRNNSILNYIIDSDDYAANVRSNTIEIQWTGIPPSANKILLMRAEEEKIDLCAESIYWQTDVPITQAGNTTVDLSNTTPPLSQIGQFYLQGILRSQTGQIIANAEYPITVIDGNIVLSFNTDKPVYRPGEIIKIIGEVKNLAQVETEGLTLEVYEDSSSIYTETFNIPPTGSHTFSFNTIAGQEGIYRLSGKVIQNSSTFFEISDRYEVAKPNISVSVVVPDVAGNEPFNINIEMKNDGRVEAVVSLQSSVNSQIQTFVIPAGEAKLIQYTEQISGDTTYTFTFTDDIDQTITKTVLYGLAGSIAINPSGIYPEGKVAIPVTITNTGQIDEALTVSFNLQPLALMQTKDYYIPKDRSVTDTLYFDLKEGSYQLSAISQQPAVSSQANFEVKKDNKTYMEILIGAQSGELIPITVKLTNIGYNNIEGNVQLSAVSSQGQIVWNGSQNASLPSSLTPVPYTLTFNINPSSIQPGNYTLKVELLDNSNQQLAVSNQPLTIKGPIFQITQFPSYQTFTVGQEGTFTFKVKNTGNQEGSFEFNFRAYDLIDSTQKEWLKPDEDKTVTFSFVLPEDLEEKDYFADYELKTFSGQQSAVRGQTKYHITGINLNVNAYLDKENYIEGDMARLTINVGQSSFSNLNLFARINYSGYESQQPFTLSGTQTLTFDIPITEITGQKLFYGIYHESGRSIHLNSLYVHQTGDVITITTNKQVYNPADTVIITVSSQQSDVTGTLTLLAPDYEETSAFTGTATKSFVLPATMTAGTYFINAQLSTPDSELINVTYPFDVAGISVKVKEATLDKTKYASSDTLNLSLTIESNQNIPATFKAWIVDPESKFVSAGERDISLSSSDNLLITHNLSLVTAVSGIHRLVYGIYTGDLLLVSGSEAFDVGDAVLTGITTNKTDYPTNTEFVNVTVSMYGTVDAILELQLDRDTVRTQPIALNGFSTLNIELGTAEPGTHILKAMLTAGGLKSTKETSFTYALSLLDSDNDGMPDEWETAHGLDPNNPDANLDPDNDELPNLQECQHKTNPNNPDTDNDGMPDGWEVTYDLNPNANDASSDKDNDGFSNLQEYQSGSNPTDPTIIPNQPPVANAGAYQNVITGTLVTLNGSESFDPEGAMITFQWTFIEVPAGSNITDASLSDATSPKPTFTPDVNGTYRLELVINDGVLESAPDEVAIIASAPNVTPNANAGPDQNVSTDATVYLNGLESDDPDNGPQPLSYLWTFGSIPGGSYLTNDHVTNRDQVYASFIPDIDGSYVINLTVSDGELSSLDTVKIMAATPNVPPNANAGPDITLYLGETATLDGSTSNDPDNSPLPLSYKWRFVAVPAGSQLNNDDISEADTVSPSFIPDVSGTYVLELMVYDGLDSAFDNVAVTVIKKAIFCSILGNDPKPSILDQDIFKFRGTIGETVTIRLESDPAEAGSGKRATLLLMDNIKGALLLKLDRSELPNEIKATLPATGEYLVTIAEQPKIAKGEKYRGEYCLSLEASQETMQTLKPAFWVE